MDSIDRRIAEARRRFAARREADRTLEEEQARINRDHKAIETK